MSAEVAVPFESRWKRRVIPGCEHVRAAIAKEIQLYRRMRRNALELGKKNGDSTWAFRNAAFHHEQVIDALRLVAIATKQWVVR